MLFLDPYTGEWDWVINNWFGLQFNSPNDIVATSDGAIWFTDPSYGATQVNLKPHAKNDAVFALACHVEECTQLGKKALSMFAVVLCH